MHGREGENWKRRRRHMWPVPAPGLQAPPVVVLSSSSSPPDSSITSSVDSFLKDGRKIRVGDCALFHAVNAPPFIGIIRWFTTGKEDSLKLCVNWLYRPADVKLQKGILEAAPNEVFYSFHKDVISAATLLHPCKVAFLRKGIELPLGISSFVCRRVYDIPNKCLWWLTDQNYINDRQEEVDQLLEKTLVEMHAAVQSGGRSPKQLNGPPSTQQFKSGADSVQNSGTSFPSQVKGKKRERGGDQGTEPIKRERPTKLEDGETTSSRLDNMIKAEMAKITEKGALTTTEGVEKLVHLMQLDRNERKIDLAGRILLADVISATERIECLGRFVQLRGVPVLDDWLQEAHKGKIGDGSSPKESDKSTEDLLLALLRALDKLPVNLNALQTCNIGKSVNHLRSHKNLEIQKKARSLVDTWKKRVDAEMTKINDAKSGGSNQAVTWPVKPGFSEVSHSGGRRSGSTEAIAKTITQSTTCKILVGKAGHADAIVKSTPVNPGSLKLPSSLPASVSVSLKDSPGKGAGSSGNSELPLATVKEEKSSSSGQSQNNSQSCSSDHAKTMGSMWKEDARSSTAGSMNANKTSGGSSRHRRSNNGFMGSGICGVQKEANLGKTGSVNRNTPLDKVSSQSGLSSERTHDMLGADHGYGHSRLIVRLPNPGRSPARSASGCSLEDPSIPGSRASSPAAPDKYDHIDRKIKLKGDACRSHISTDVNAESWQSNDVKEGLAGSDEGDRSPAAAPVEEHRNADEAGRATDTSRATCSSSGNGKAASLIEPKSRNSFSSMNALIESCAKYSEPSVPISAGDDIGINLLANVAAGEISKSELASHSASPGSSPKEEPSAANTEAKSRFSCDEGGAQNRDQSDEIADYDSAKQEKSDPLAASEKFQDSSMHLTGDGKIISSKPESKLTNTMEGLKGDGANQSATDDNKPINYIREKIADGSKKTSDVAVNPSVDGGDNDLPATGNESDKLGADESSLVNEVTSVADLADQPRPPVTENHVEAADISGKDAIPSSTTDKVPCAEIADACRVKKADQLEGSNSAPNDSARKEQTSSALISNEHPGSAAEGTGIRVDEILERKETLENHHAFSGHEPTSAVPIQESEKCAKSIAFKSSGADPDIREEISSSAEASSALVTSETDTGSKLDFDLNEGFSGDDGNQSEQITSLVPACSPAVRLPNLPPFASSVSNGPPAPITVAAPAKGPFVPPENLLKSKGEPGWKGSAATSAFRPAEPRKVLEMQLNTYDVQSSDTAAGKQGRPPLNIDLNVPDERVIEDMASQSSPQTTGSESGVISNRDAPTPSAGGLDLDLNKADEGADYGQYLASTSGRLEVPFMSVKPLCGGFPNGEANMLIRDFDLNNGPGLDEVGAETIPKSQHAKSSSNMSFLSPISGLRIGNAELGNVSSWFPPGNSYSAVAIPSFLPDRGEQSYPIVAAPGSQRFLSSVTGSGTFGGDVYRGPVLSSSPAMAFPPSAAFQYAGFPFGSSFPLAPTSFSGGSTPYADSSSGAASCFPAIPSQLVGPAGAVSSHYARPYVVSLPEGSTSAAGSESNRKWGRHGLDLNAGPGSSDVDVKDDRIPYSASRQLPITSSQAFVEEQARMYHASGGGMKRKEREGGSWEERYYKQPSWQ